MYLASAEQPHYNPAGAKYGDKASPYAGIKSNQAATDET